MNRYRSYGETDDQPQPVGDGSFRGVDEYNASENIAQSEVQQAVNLDFSSQDAITRGGFVCLPELGNTPFELMWEGVSIGSERLTDTTYGNGVYVTVGDSGTIYTSTDTVTWTLRTCPDNIDLVKVDFREGIFVAVGTRDTGGTNKGILISTDGVTWNYPASVSSGRSYHDISYGLGKWVALGVYATQDFVSTSTDGLTWSLTLISVGGSPLTADLQNINYGNGIFVAISPSVGSGDSYISYDGTTWALSQATGATAVSEIGDMDFSGEYFFAISTGASSPNKVFRSTDGTNWTTSYEGPGSGEIQSTSAYGNGFYLVGGPYESGYSDYGRIWSTLHGKSLRERSSIPIPDQTYRIVSLKFANGKFIATGGKTSVAGYIAFNNTAGVSVYASGVYSDPREAGSQWVMMAGYNEVCFHAFGKSGRIVPCVSGQTITEQSTIVQCNNLVYIFRGEGQTPLYWDGDWDHNFELAPTPTPASGFEVIPGSNQATYYQNRLWVKKDKDFVLGSDVLDFNTYETITNGFNLNTGSSDFIVATYPFGEKTLLVFKNKSILALNNVNGSLADVTSTEVTRQVGLVGINAITAVGPDLAYVSYRNINLISLTATNNAVQHKTMPLSFKIRKIMDRVNWNYAWKIALGYANNKLYVSLPVDNSTFCNCVAVYNFVTNQWFGEWNFDDSMDMCVQGWVVADYLGLQRIQAVTEDGRVFVVDEGQNDISGDTVAEITTKLVTRAYDTSGLNHYQRRAFLDLATNRPNFSVVAYTEGASESSTIVSNQTYTRSESWKFNDSAYDLTNANNDYNRAYRKDYSTGPDDVQTGTGFQPEMLQEYRLPVITRRQGRLSWLEITNTKGILSVMSAGFETRPGQRSNLIQV